jgi:hypothetical protein
LIEWEEKLIKWRLEVGTSILTCSHVTHVGVGMEDMIQGIPNFAEEEKRQYDHIGNSFIVSSTITLFMHKIKTMVHWILAHARASSF